MRYAWFNPQNTAVWADRSSAAFVNNLGIAQNNYTITAAGTYCLVVFEDNLSGLTQGTVTASITTGTTTGPLFQASAISVPSPPVTVAPGGTFTASPTIRNAGTAAGTTPYSIYISTDATITTSDTLVFSGTSASIAAGGSWTGTDTCTVPGGQATGSYYVGLYIAAGNTAVTINQDLIVATGGSPPGNFNLVSPSNGATGVSTNPTYTWAAATGATTYTLQVATDAGMTAFVINNSGITGTSSTPATTLSNGTTYYWRVIAVNGNGTTTSTNAPWSFTTSAAPTPPGNFDLVAPVNGATGISMTPQYSWNAASGATAYRLQVCSDVAMTVIVLDRTGITGTFDTPPTALNPGTQYFWHVIASNAIGTTTSNGSPWSFTTSSFDPVASSITLLETPVEVPRGGIIKVTRNILNNGTTAGTAAYSIYLSTDPLIDASDLLLFQAVTGSIAPAATDSATHSLTVPAAAVEGQTYYVGLYLTPAKTATSADTLLVVNVEPESALGCAGGGAAPRGPWALLPLALLAVALAALRFRGVRAVRS
jgi:hypothetical protein